MPTKVTADQATFVTPALPATALVNGRAVVNVQLVLPTPSGTPLTSATKTADHFTYLGPTVTLAQARPPGPRRAGHR